MIPVAMGAILFLPTPWMGALMAVLLLAGLHEWCALAGLDRPQAKWTYLAAHAALVAAIAWTDDAAHRNLLAAIAIGGAFWLLVPLWLWKFDFAAAA